MSEPTRLSRALLTAVSQTLENMAFTEALEHYNPEYRIPAEELVWASILIRDPAPGELRLAMTEQGLRSLTGAIFGLSEEELSTAQMNDILHELLNTIAGLFMTALLEEDQTFQLGLPEPGEGPLPEAEEQTLTCTLMTAEEDPLVIIVNGAPLLALNR